MQRLLLTEPQADFLADAIEAAIEDAHAETLEHEEGTSEHDEACDSIVALQAVLSQIDEENPILDADFKPGREFDWEAFWKSAAEADEDDEEPEAPVDSVAPSSSRMTG